MPNTQLQPDISFLKPIDESAYEALSKITTIYTDLDGTLLAPGGKLLTNFAGEPSYATAKAIVDLREAGVQIIVVTGRSRFQGNEFIRILDAQAFIGEMGTTKQERDAGALDVTYDTGDFEYDSSKYATPYDAIVGSGADKLLLETYKGKVERNYPRCLNRDVTHAMRGKVDVDEVNRFFKDNGYALEFEDNGMLFSPMPNTTLDDTTEIHGYHIVPANTSKAISVRKDMEQRGLSKEETASIGDGHADIKMGNSTGMFVMMRNGLRNERNRQELTKIPRPVYVTNGLCCDGWVEFANAILAAKKHLD